MIKMKPPLYISKADRKAKQEKLQRFKDKYKNRKTLVKLDKEKKLLQAVDMWINGNTIRKISEKVGVPKSTVHGWLSSQPSIGLIKKRGLEVIDAKLTKSALKDIDEHERTRNKASHAELTISLGTKIDKLRPPFAMAQQFNIGDKKVEVNMPKFFKPRGKK